jgi:NAD(P)-dependent dehydrogenase (short-subunit alcohol dehydrogenase family)
MKLEGKVAIVTGGSRGIGRATVLALAKEGCRVSFTYLEHKDRAEEVLRELEARGHEGMALRCDVAHSEDARRVVDATVDRFGKLDILVNNAGVLIPASIDELTDEVWERTLQVNLKGALNMCRWALPHLRKRGGRIVNVSSIAGLMGGVVGVHYAASKAGLLGFTRALAPEVAPDGILVNSIAPDAVDTEMLLPELRPKVEKLNLLRRVLRPEEVAQGILFLAKTETLTGQTLNFNAGRYVF